MFFSKVVLKHGTEIFEVLRGKQSSDGYTSHKILWKLFPNDGTKKRDFIFRKDEQGVIPQFYMVSAEEPVPISGITVTSKPYNPQLSDGQSLAFSLIANPIVARKKDGRKRSVKHDVWMDAKKRAKERGLKGNEQYLSCEMAAKKWLVKQGTQNGFHIEETMFVIVGYHQNRFYKNKSNDLIRFSTVHFEGKLTVTEPDKFQKILFQGLGHAKGFGCGMMLVRKI